MTDQCILSLTKANGKWLDTAYFGTNPLTNRSCGYLAQSQWPNMKYMSLVYVKISIHGLRALCKAQWPLLRQLDLTFHKGAMNIIWLGQIHWTNLTDLFLGKEV